MEVLAGGQQHCLLGDVCLHGQGWLLCWAPPQQLIGASCAACTAHAALVPVASVPVDFRLGIAEAPLDLFHILSASPDQALGQVWKYGDTCMSSLTDTPCIGNTYLPEMGVQQKQK